ncbi:MAG: hypothetical protein KC420_12985, partial [Myxococcales bacterium]|nr:hypothetical protein [Myxococcales bacterium]
MLRPTPSPTSALLLTAALGLTAPRTATASAPALGESIDGDEDDDADDAEAAPTSTADASDDPEGDGDPPAKSSSSTRGKKPRKGKKPKTTAAESPAPEDGHTMLSDERESMGRGGAPPVRTEVPASTKKRLPGVKLSKELDVRMIGSVSFNANYRTWPKADGSGPEGASVSFERIAFGLEGTYRNFVISADYRFYGKYGTIHHGYIGYKKDDVFEIDVGVHRVPFGILPYASHNWFETLPYYVGLADDYDLGAKAIIKKGGLDLQLAYYVGAEGSQFGRTMDSARYSYDLVETDSTELGDSGVTSPQTNKERHAGVARVAYGWSHRGDDKTEIGASGQFGGIYNGTTQRYGSRWAAAFHYMGWYRNFSLQVEALYYQYRPNNPAGQPRTWVTLGAWDAPYRVAAEGFIGVANIGYRIPLGGKAFDWVMFYNDHSLLLKPRAGFDRTHMNVTGLLLANDFIYLYLDTATGRNHPWFSPEYGNALAEGDQRPK